MVQHYVSVLLYLLKTNNLKSIYITVIIIEIIVINMGMVMMNEIGIIGITGIISIMIIVGICIYFDES